MNVNSVADFVVVSRQFGEIVLAHGNDPALEFFRSIGKAERFGFVIPFVVRDDLGMLLPVDVEVFDGEVIILQHVVTNGVYSVFDFTGTLPHGVRCLFEVERVEDVSRSYSDGKTPLLSTLVSLEMNAQFVALYLGTEVLAVNQSTIVLIRMDVFSIDFCTGEPRLRIIAARKRDRSLVCRDIIHAVGYLNRLIGIPFHRIPISVLFLAARGEGESSKHHEGNSPGFHFYHLFKT